MYAVVQPSIERSVIAASIGKVHGPIGWQVSAVIVNNKQGAGIGYYRNMYSWLRISVPTIAII